MNKAKLNYWVDMGIGIAFLLSAVSGLVFLLPGGHGTVPSTGILCISYSVWDRLHIWSSLTMIAGVLAHVVLHRSWVGAMTRKVFGYRVTQREGSVPVAVPTLTRRRVLSLGCAAAITGLVAACAAVVAGTEALRRDLTDGSTQPDLAEELLQSLGQGTRQTADGDAKQSGGEEIRESASEEAPHSEDWRETQQSEGPVACPRGTVNDPYPGRCRLYTDRDGDGICDYSVPGSGAQGGQ